MDVEVGDCIDSNLPEGIDIENVTIVLCSGEWQYRALNSIPVSDGPFPGEVHFAQLAQESCDERWSDYLSPILGSWEAGDRAVICLQDSYGLSVTSPEKLDRLIGSDRLGLGQCFNEAPETDFVLVEIVGCERDWEFRLIDSFEIEGFVSFPGDGPIDRAIALECDRRYSTSLSPLVETWAVGDRTVLCLQESYGLVGNLEKIDRLVDINSLSTGECFSEAPETQFAMAELVDCIGEWDFRVANTFEVAIEGPYPGAIYMDRQAELFCGPAYDNFIPPNAETWPSGDRLVICMFDQ